MNALWPVTLMIACEAGIILYAASKAVPFYLRILGVVVNMLVIALYGPFLVSISGWTTNVGCIWFVAATVSLCIIMEQYGRHAARVVIPLVYAAQTGVIMIGFLLHSFPAVPDNPAMTAILVVSDHSLRVVAGSFSAFFLSVGMVLIPAWTALRPRLGVVKASALACIACQIVDTPAFFIPAFWGVVPDAKLLEIMAVGLAFKVMLAVVFMPVVWLATTDRLSAWRQQQPRLA